EKLEKEKKLQEKKKKSKKVTFSSKPAYKKEDKPKATSKQTTKPKSTPYKQKKHSQKKKDATLSPEQLAINELKAEELNNKSKRDIVSDQKGKKKTKDFEDKKKHIQNKLKSKKSKKKYKYDQFSVQEEAKIQQNIKNIMSDTSKKKKYKKTKQKEDDEEPKQITLSEFTSVSELAKIMDVSPTVVITKFFEMGQMFTINQRLDRDSLEMICAEMNFDVEFEEEYGADIIEEEINKLDEDYELVDRAPIVTIMGHVDHGKTSILDYIRDTNVIAGESGGITQHIGAYQVDIKQKKITFLDTPGHEAFTAMRARGANVTDIAVIVVAANDGVKPQTIEAIDHAKAAGVEIIVAINKIDLPEANIDKTISDLAKQNLFLESYGGDIVWTATSAKTGEGIDELLEMILLSAEMSELESRNQGPALGIVIESKLTTNKGTTTTVLLQEGNLSQGDYVVAGATNGKIRRMEDERGKKIKSLNPSDVAVIYGIKDVPKAGDVLTAVEDEKKARLISAERKQKRLERAKYRTTTNLDNLFDKIKDKSLDELKLIVKADTDGSMEALCDSFEKLSNDEVKVTIIRKGVGGIVVADTTLAEASDAIIIGFHVRVNGGARKQAEESNIDIKLYEIIFDAINDIKMSLEGMLKPEFKEVFLGSALVKQVFKIKNVGVIAGSFVKKGVIRKESLVRIYRNDKQIYSGEMSSLKHYDKDVAEMKAGTECGIGIANYNDLKKDDLIEIFIEQEIKRKL
ncbi:MAG: translation initiation factor IF-2, partial [Candidatus Cloacimonadota bacterium]|nr:translation initiation factor IF-2 [Candidatus Cloacimonadota bacterium]